MDLTRKNWAAGWTPSESLDGDPAGLLRMDNLHQEENGALSLVKSPVQLNTSSFDRDVTNVFSRYIDGQKIRYVGLGTDNTTIFRSQKGDFSDKVEICEGEGRTAFGSALGWVLCATGGTRKKDNGTTTWDLGLTTPTSSPVVTSIGQPYYPVMATFLDFFRLEGTEVDFFKDAGLVSDITDPVTFRAAFAGFANYDLYYFSGPPTKNPENDIFTISVNSDDPTKIQRVRVEFALDFGDTVPDTDFQFTPNNSYAYEFQNFDGGNKFEQFRTGPHDNIPLTCLRSEFVRSGTNTALDWRGISAFRVTFICTAKIICAANEIKFLGGLEGTLNGAYEYVQINVADLQSYQAKSQPGPSSGTVNVINGHVFIQVDTNSIDSHQISEVWLYRRGLDLPSSDYPLAVLDKYYRVAVIKGLDIYGVHQDIVSDDEAIKTNLFLNESLETVKNIEEDIIGMEGIYYERMLYMTTGFIYISDRLNPDQFDSRYTLRASGDPVERNLWIKKVTNGTLVLGTTKDLYEITGTFNDLPDGTLDILIRPIGESYPPISKDFAFNEGTLFYMAADGVRATVGTNSVLLSPQLNKVFQDEDGRYGLAKVEILPDNEASYPMAIGRSRLYVSVPLVDRTRNTLVFDVLQRRWRPETYGPGSFYVEEDDTVLAGIGHDLFNFEGGSGAVPSIYFQTVFDDNGQPRHRKDTFTLKLVANTGNVPVKVFIAKDNAAGAYTELGSFTSDGIGTAFFVLHPEQLGFRYSIKLTGENLTSFSLYYFTIEYTPRPEQLNYLYIDPTNLGSAARKRIVNYAFSIDTLGNAVTFTPIVDNVAGTPSTVTTSTKQTFLHYFTQETIGTDFAGILSGGVFEFYALSLDEITSERCPVPMKYLVIPANNYGSPNRKRHSSYKFQINTREGLVKFRPFVDSLGFPELYFINGSKSTVEYFFGADTIGIEVEGILSCAEGYDTPFEFYGVVVPQQIEELPPRLTEFRIPENNFGVAAKKRIRTLPLYINTNSEDITFTPIVDGVRLAPSTVNTASKATAFHYFDTDVFGIDFSGELNGIAGGRTLDLFVAPTPFEFYGMLKPEDVEVLPVAKKYDQIGPFRYDKLAKLYAFRVRLITPDATLPFAVYNEDKPTGPTYPALPFYQGNIITQPNTDEVYHVILPKNINGNILRLTLGGPTSSPFHRYKNETFLKISDSGMETSAKWVPDAIDSKY